MEEKRNGRKGLGEREEYLEKKKKEGGEEQEEKEEDGEKKMNKRKANLLTRTMLNNKHNFDSCILSYLSHGLREPF